MQFLARNRILIYRIGFVVLIVFSASLLFFHLGREPFQDYDEATYAQVTRESVAHGNYLSFTYLNQPFYKKPPLLTWITAGIEHTLPHEELAMRLPSAFAAFALVLLVLAVCLELGTGWGTALCAGSILATTASAMEPARQARYDTLVSFFITSALYSALRATRDRRWYLVMGASIGLAVLSKNVIAIFAVIAIGVYFFSEKRFKLLSDIWLWYGVVVALLVAAPWHIYMTYAHGAAFWNSYLVSEVLDRAGTNLFVGAPMLTTNTDYFRYFFGFAAPWSELFVLILVFLPLVWKQLTKREQSVLLSSLTTIAAIFVVVFVSKTKAVTYLIPVYPFMSITIALCVCGAWRRSNHIVRAILLCAAIITIGISAYVCTQDTLHLTKYYSAQYGLAREEYEISQTILSKSHDPYMYTYKSDTLGSVQYYTRLPFGSYKFVYLLDSATTTPTNAFVLTTAPQQELSLQFPQHIFIPLFIGSYLSVFQISH